MERGSATASRRLLSHELGQSSATVAEILPFSSFGKLILHAREVVGTVSANIVPTNLVFSVMDTSGVLDSVLTLTPAAAVSAVPVRLPADPTTALQAATKQYVDAHDPTPAALTAANDTNVTLTLGGTPATALLQASSITEGWAGTLAVPRGGTGLATATAYAVLCGGTTSTGAFQNVASVGTSGQVLTSNGAGALPTFQPAAGGGGGGLLDIQKFTASGTYTPTAGMVNCIIECVGGGAGGCSITGQANYCYVSGGGGSGGYSRKLATASDIGASKPVTIGAGGTGGAYPGSFGGNPGNPGGDTSIGSLCIAHGAPAQVTTGAGGGWQPAGAGAAAGTGDLAMPGSPGGPGAWATSTAANLAPGFGGSSYFGGGAVSPLIAPSSGGYTLANNATGYGSGGSGGVDNNSAAGVSGGNGSAGIVIITEYH